MRRYTVWIFICIVLAITACGWLIAPFDPYQTGIAPPAQPPGVLSLGSDTLGRDLFSRILHGGPLTLSIGVGAAFIAWTAGAVLGAAATVGPQWLRPVAHLFIEAFLALPTLLIALVAVAGTGTSLPSLVLAVGVAQAGVAAQVWRGVTQSTLREPFIESAAALGATRRRIAISHILPNVLPPLLSYLCVLFASSVLMASGLSFLGLAGDPSSPDWGNLLAEGRRAIRYAPWILLAPSAGLILVTSALNTAARLFNPR